MTFKEIHVPENADDATEWACWHEFELRQVNWAIEDDSTQWALEREHELRAKHMRRAKIGLSGMLREMTTAMRRFNEKLQGDPDVP